MGEWCRAVSRGEYLMLARTPGDGSSGTGGWSFGGVVVMGAGGESDALLAEAVREMIAWI
jgi:hypothetical protein